jgi:hypothetical protein
MPPHILPPRLEDMMARMQMARSTRSKIAFIGFGSVAAYYLLTEHTAHVLGALPFLILLSCPLMHLFMHHGHEPHHEHQNPPDERVSLQPGEPK